MGAPSISPSGNFFYEQAGRKSKIVEPIQQIYPTGKSPILKPFVQKYSDFQNPQISLYLFASRPTRKGVAQRSPARGGDAMDADGAPDQGG